MSTPLILHPADKIAVLTARVGGGDPLGVGVALAKPIAPGHKIARRDISVGTAIVRFGQFIGAETADIAAG